MAAGSLTAGTLINQVVLGLVLGTTLLLVTVGLSLIFGIMGIVNFAHGEFYMLGAYAAFAVVSATGSFALALVGAAAATAVVGVLTEVYVVRPLYERDPMQVLLATFGLSIVLQEAVKLVWGASPKPLSVPDWMSGSVTVLDAVLLRYWAFVVAVTTVVMVAVVYALRSTTYGLYVRAAAQDSRMLGLLGVDDRVVYTGVFAVGVGLAGLSGAVIAPLRGVMPVMGTKVIGMAFLITVLGGLGSVRGTAIGSLLVGEVLTLSALVVPSYSEALAYSLLIVVLVFRSQGLMGAPGRVE
jgi:branched-subunit amino acid ABC-type transport system permease component